jgi:hypothetical protein
MEPTDTSSLLMTVNVTFNVPSLAIVLSVLVFLAVYAGTVRYRRYRTETQQVVAARHVVEYFRQHGSEVAAHCFSVLGGLRYVAVVESPPLKRFRYSHIIESSLILHLQKVAGIAVEKVYWRFPLAWQNDAAMQAAGKAVEDDPYFFEQKTRLKETLGSYQVEDASWDSYQASSQKNETKDD